MSGSSQKYTTVLKTTLYGVGASLVVIILLLFAVHKAIEDRKIAGELLAVTPLLLFSQEEERWVDKEVVVSDIFLQQTKIHLRELKKIFETESAEESTADESLYRKFQKLDDYIAQNENGNIQIRTVSGDNMVGIVRLVDAEIETKVLNSPVGKDTKIYYVLHPELGTFITSPVLLLLAGDKSYFAIGNHSDGLQNRHNICDALMCFNITGAEKIIDTINESSITSQIRKPDFFAVFDIDNLDFYYQEAFDEGLSQENSLRLKIKEAVELGKTSFSIQGFDVGIYDFYLYTFAGFLGLLGILNFNLKGFRAKKRGKDEDWILCWSGNITYFPVATYLFLAPAIGLILLMLEGLAISGGYFSLPLLNFQINPVGSNYYFQWTGRWTGDYVLLSDLNEQSGTNWSVFETRDAIAVLLFAMAAYFVVRATYLLWRPYWFSE